MDTKLAFQTIRGGIRADIKDGGLDRESAAMTLAMVDVVEELMSKLERIAVAAETHLKLAERNAS